MIFWIIVGIAAVVAVIVFYINAHSGYVHWYVWEGLGWGSLWGAITLGFGTGILMVVTMGLHIWYPTPTGVQHRSELSALSVGEDVQGKFSSGFFVGYGYIEGERVIEYMVEEDDGAFRLLRVDADDSRVYQGEADPYMVEREMELRNDWIIPWGMHRDSQYDFHVPEGSVLTDQYVVENG